MSDDRRETGLSRTIDLRLNPEADLSDLLEHLRDGGLVAYPTETVYGLGSACTTEGVHRVRMTKRREAKKPLIALVESVRQVEGLRWTEQARELARIFWPGAVTLVLDDPRGMFPPGVGIEGTVGVRMSSHPVPARLVSELGGAVTSTSLNEPGSAPVSSGHEARAVLERLGVADVWVIDGGALPASGPSTIVDCTKSEPVVLREGTVPIGRLRCAIPEIHGYTAK
jgi:L-threonylcarbamoyladenylate synthase